LATWRASSRVGTSISALVPLLGEAFSRKRCSVGNKKAAVFPLPVFALTSKSLPAMARGIAWACTGVILSKPSLVTAFSKRSCKASSENKNVTSV